MIDRCGLNIGIDADLVEDIEEYLLTEMGIMLQDPEVYPILSGNGLHYSHYSKADASDIARFIKATPSLAACYATFTAELS